MLNDLIKRAEEVKKRDDKSFEIEIDRFKRLGIEGNIKVRRPDSSVVTSFIERNHDSAYLLGECIIEPNLSDKELMKTYKAKSKKELVKKIFSEEEITDIDNVIGSLIRNNKSVSLVETVVDDIKN